MRNKNIGVGLLLIVCGILAGLIAFGASRVASVFIREMIPVLSMSTNYMIMFVSFLVILSIVFYVVMHKTVDRLIYPFGYKLLYVVSFIGIIVLMYTRTVF